MCKFCVSAGLTTSYYKDNESEEYYSHRNKGSKRNHIKHIVVRDDSGKRVGRSPMKRGSSYLPERDKLFNSSSPIRCEKCDCVLHVRFKNYLMIKNAIWNKLFPNNVLVCRSCIEKKMKRPLKEEDVSRHYRKYI